MDAMINGKTPEEIKRRLKCASFDCNDINCYDCEYLDICESVNKRSSAKDALDLIEYLEAQQPKWISVEERLPAPEQLVLAYIPEQDFTFGEIRMICGWAFRETITHWMPLPEPPEENR